MDSHWRVHPTLHQEPDENGIVNNVVSENNLKEDPKTIHEEEQEDGYLSLITVPGGAYNQNPKHQEQQNKNTTDLLECGRAPDHGEENVKKECTVINKDTHVSQPLSAAESSSFNADGAGSDDDRHCQGVRQGFWGRLATWWSVRG